MTRPAPFVHASIRPEALARLAAVLAAWQAQGATFVALPWVAPEPFILATRPPYAGHDAPTPHGHLVASGEQSFCWLARAGALPDTGTFVGFTPCFRDEPVFDAHHHYGFLKAEVFAWLDPAGESESTQVQALAQRAADILAAHAPVPPRLVRLPGGTWDLDLDGLEVGSVGARDLPGEGPARRYLYATALAEPRFSQALARLGPGTPA